MIHISSHIINVYQRNDVYGLKHYLYVDDNYGNLTPVSAKAHAAGNYSMEQVISWDSYDVAKPRYGKPDDS